MSLVLKMQMDNWVFTYQIILSTSCVVLLFLFSNEAVWRFLTGLSHTTKPLFGCWTCLWLRVLLSLKRTGILFWQNNLSFYETQSTRGRTINILFFVPSLDWVRFKTYFQGKARFPSPLSGPVLVDAAEFQWMILFKKYGVQMHTMVSELFFFMC